MSLISSVLRLIDATHPENFSGEKAEEDAKIEREKQLKEMRATQRRTSSAKKMLQR